MSSDRSIIRAALAVAAAAVLVLSGCSAENGDNTEQPPANESVAPTAPEESGEAAEPAESGEAADAAGQGDYAFGADRDTMASAIEKAFNSSNGKASWEGDTLVLQVDGDATSMLAGFTECRVLEQLLLETDLSMVRYPNGDVDCAEVLAE